MACSVVQLHGAVMCGAVVYRDVMCLIVPYRIVLYDDVPYGVVLFYPMVYIYVQRYYIRSFLKFMCQTRGDDRAESGRQSSTR